MKKIITLGFIACASLTNNTTFGMLIQQIKNHTKTLAAPKKKYTDDAKIIRRQVLTRLEQQNVLLTHQLAETQKVNQKLSTVIDKLSTVIDDMIINNITKTVKTQQNNSSNKLEVLKESPLFAISRSSKYNDEVAAYYEKQLAPGKE